MEKNQLCKGRICSVRRNEFRILYEGQELGAVLKGSFYREDKNHMVEFPVVGDYVWFTYNSQGSSRIEKIEKRKSLLKRPDQSGHAIGYVKTMVEQPMIANFDYIFILTSLNDNYNTNRVARYVSITLQGGGIPVVVLTKSDLCDDVDSYIEEVRSFSKDVRVHAISSIKGEGLNQLQEYLKPGNTIALLGSSGVGKSTLVNALANEEVMKTGAIRMSDSKGRHTTTSRELMVLENDVILIDTPGMRELGMCDVDEGIDDAFEDIQSLMMQCRFRNCTHTKEPGCAICAALESGELEAKRYELYQKLKNESTKQAKMKANRGKHH